MKEIFAKVLAFLKKVLNSFFCLFKLTISCTLGFKDKEEDSKKGGHTND